MCTSVFAYDGMMAGEKDLRVSKTKWFDIIYPARCSESAKILYDNADSVYEDIAQQYGVPPQYRMPVVICPAVESFNGFWTNSPYNHIVLYDTAIIDDLAVYSETLIQLFRHECTHAYTYNLKNKFWYVISKIFGDPVDLSSVLITSGLAEGATLTSESSTGDGRLNDEYARQMVKQAKIENKFPMFHDIQGAADCYPYGSFYYFNGGFNEWLQKQYGMLCYANWWYLCVNVKRVTMEWAFKKAFGIRIKKAWQMYQDSIQVPDISANPVEDGKAFDFFKPEKETYSSINNAGSRFENLCVSERGVFYTDSTSSEVFYIPSDELNDVENKPTYLFEVIGLNSLSCSKDGRYLIVNYYKKSDVTVRSLTKIYDMDSCKFIKIQDHGFYEPAIVQKGADYFIVRQSYDTPYYGIQIDSLNQLENPINVKFEQDVIPFSFCDLGDGTFAYIQKKNLHYSIEIRNLKGSLIKSYSAPINRMVIRSISYSNGNLYFSWTEPGSMPRLGMLNLSENQFQLQNDDVSGGVYEPCILPSGEVVYIGCFYRENRIFTTDEARLARCIPIIDNAEPLAEEADISTLKEFIDETPYHSQGSIPSIKYNPLAYYTRGIFFPFPTASSESCKAMIPTTYDADYGFTYISGNPWTDGSNLLQFSGGYVADEKSWLFNFSYAGGTDTEIFKYQLTLSTEFDKRGWKSGALIDNISSQIPLGSRSYVYGALDNTFNLARPRAAATLIDRASVSYSEDLNYYFYSKNIASLGFTNAKYSGPGSYQADGFTFIASAYNVINSRISDGYIYGNNTDFRFTSTIYIPRLLPIECRYNMTYNLPVRLHFNIFPVDVFDSFEKLDTNTILYFEMVQPIAAMRASVLLFGYNIQKASTIPWLYFRDIQISLAYMGVLDDIEAKHYTMRVAYLPEYFNQFINCGMNYHDYAGLSIDLQWGPNYGGFANSNNKNTVSFEFGFSEIANLNREMRFEFKVGVSTCWF